MTDIIQKDKKIALSLVLCTRNDMYQGDSIWRLATALNYVADNVLKLKRENEVEIVIADWGSKVPLSEALNLPTETLNLVSFVHIPKEIAVKEQKDSPFPEVLALNSAIRRAKGQYIGRIDQDTLVGKEFLKIFFDLLEGRRELDVPLETAIMLSNRRRIPYRFAVKCPSFKSVKNYIQYFSKILPLMEPPPRERYYQCYIGILLFHRDLWTDCRGYDETFIYMDYMEFDLILRLMKKYNFVVFGEVVDHDFYHLDHEDPRKAWGVNRNRKSNPKRTIEQPPPVFAPNGVNWGLNSYNEIKSVSRQKSTEQSNENILLQADNLWLLAATSTLQIVLDEAICKIWYPTKSVIFKFFKPWRRRFRTASQTIKGEPIGRWPELLHQKWQQGQHGNSQ